jgi:PAS domain S-box-containing protein
MASDHLPMRAEGSIAAPLGGAIGEDPIEDPTEKTEGEKALRAEILALRKEVKDLARLHEVGWRLREAESLREGLDEILAATMDLLGADMGAVQVIDAAGKQLDVAAQRGFDPECLQSVRAVGIDADTACARAVREGEPVVIEDIDLDPSFAPHRSMARGAGYRAVLSAPLFGPRGALQGTISTYFRSPHRPSDTDLQRFGLYRRRTADFIERTRFNEALRESNAKLAAESRAIAKFHEFGLKVVQAQDLQQALEIMVAGTLEMLGADKCIIRLLDSKEKSLRIAAQQGFNRAFIEQAWEVAVADDTPYGKTLRTGLPIVIEDTEADAAYAPFRDLAREADYRAIVSTPLVGRYGKLQGVMSLYFRSPHRPSDSDLQRLEFYRRRGGDFIERFKAEDALRESNARLAAEAKAFARFYEASLRLSEGKTLQEGLDATLTGAIDVLGADMGAVQLLDRGSNLLRIVAHYGLNQEFLDFFREFSPGQDGAFARSLRSGKLVVIDDTERDGSAEFRSIRRAAGYRALVAAPLVDSGGTHLGMLSAYFRMPHRPSDSEMHWLELYRRRVADFIQRIRAQEAQRESEERLRLAVTVSRMGTFDCDLITGTFVWSDECYRMLGYQVGEVEPSQSEWMARVHPDDRKAAEAAETAAKLEHTEFISEYRIVRRDGGVRWIRAHGRFFYDGDKPVRMIGLKQDITEPRQQIEVQRVLVAELQHRTRNLMAVVQSIAHSTLDTADSLADFEGRFNRRLDALSRVQSLLSRADSEPITLRALLLMEFEALGLDAGGDKILIGGPEARLRKSVVEMVALAIHELLTNSIKHGALAGDSGGLSVIWRIEGGPTDQRLVLDWAERGIACLAPTGDANYNGYGRTLIEEALPYSLSAETTFELGAEGLRCRISLPLSPHHSDAVA